MYGSYVIACVRAPICDSRLSEAGHGMTTVVATPHDDGRPSGLGPCRRRAK